MNNLLAENIRKYRKASGLTQDGLAEKLGITLGTISKWERGSSEPDVDYIMDMAELFRISVDALIGFSLRGNSIDMVLEKIDGLCSERKLKEAVKECDVALMKFPNDFKAVNKAADTYMFYAFEADAKDYFRKAKEQYRHCLELYPQNEDGVISKNELYNSLASCHLHLDEFEEAIEIYKKNNTAGINNSVIGLTYVHELKNTREAEPYIMKAFLRILQDALTTFSAFTILYREKREYKKCIEASEWMMTFIESVKKDKSKKCFYDKFISLFYLISAFAFDGLKNSERSEEYLKKAVESAKSYDEAPCITMTNILFLDAFENANIYDDYSTTSIDGLIRTFNESEAFLSDAFKERFKEIIGG